MSTPYSYFSLVCISIAFAPGGSMGAATPVQIADGEMQAVGEKMVSYMRAEMRATSPKYVPREWMLAAAYTKAEKGDFSVLHELLEVLTSPFDEHTPEIAAKYYRRPPTELEKKAGLAYFS